MDTMSKLSEHTTCCLRVILRSSMHLLARIELYTFTQGLPRAEIRAPHCSPCAEFPTLRLKPTWTPRYSVVPCDAVFRMVMLGHRSMRSRKQIHPFVDFSMCEGRSAAWISPFNMPAVTISLPTHGKTHSTNSRWTAVNSG